LHNKDREKFAVKPVLIPLAVMSFGIQKPLLSVDTMESGIALPESNFIRLSLWSGTAFDFQKVRRLGEK
jgi:hypothetical protein